MPDGRSKSAAFQYKTAYKFNEPLRKASAEGALNDNPKFKKAVDDSAFPKKGCKKNKRSSYKMLNIKNKSNKPCPGCKSICPSCRGKK